MKEDQYRSQFRLPYSLYEKLKASANEHGDSINKELVSRLERSFATQDMGFKTDGLDIAAYLAMSLMVAVDNEVAPEMKQKVLAKAREIARPLIDGMVFSQTGSSVTEPAKDE